MNYQTFLPHKNLSSFVKCYWTLEGVAEDKNKRQRIIPDGCIEMAFILGDDIKRFINEREYHYQPRAMVLGQFLEPFLIEPTGYVNTFSVRFYPHGFSNFISTTLDQLSNQETPLGAVFEENSARNLENRIVQAADTESRIAIVEDFLFQMLRNKSTISQISQKTIDALLATKGQTPLHTILKQTPSKKRQLERNFQKHVGISPKQLGRVIRFQAALEMLLNTEVNSLGSIGYENNYYDQAHFIKDFKYFTGSRPKDFFDDDELLLSSLFYKKE